MVLTSTAPRDGSPAPTTIFAISPARSASTTVRDAVSRFARLEHTISVALSSSDYPDASTWGDSLGAALMVLAGASAGAIQLPGPIARWRLISALDTEIAERLGVRFFTARNHVERTLAKLGVMSRHRVGPLLRSEAEAEGSNRAA